MAMKSKLILTGMAFAMLLTAPLGARAADMPRRYREPAYVTPAYATWTGFYVGVNGGYGFGSSDWDVPAVSPSPKGALAGGTLGYNLQTGLWVWGLEADFDWADMKASVDLRRRHLREQERLVRHRAPAPRLCRLEQLAALYHRRRRLRRRQGHQRRPTVSGQQDPCSAGPPALGIEYAFLGNWSAKVEYLYADLGTVDCGDRLRRPRRQHRRCQLQGQYRAARRQLPLLSATACAVAGKAPGLAPGLFAWRAGRRRAAEGGAPRLHALKPARETGRHRVGALEKAFPSHAYCGNP